MAEIDIDAVTERVTSEQSAARKTPFDNKAAGVGKPKKFRPRGGKGAKARLSASGQRAAKASGGQCQPTKQDVWEYP